MPDDAAIQTAIERAFRRKLAASPATITVADIEAHADRALAALADGRTVTQMNLEGGGGSGVINCSPSTLLNACETVLAEQTAGTSDIAPTGTRNLNLSDNRIET